MYRKRNYDERFIALVDKLSTKAFDDRSDEEITRRLFELMCFWVNRLLKMESVNKVISSELKKAELSFEDSIKKESPTLHLKYKQSNDGFVSDFIQMSYVQLYHKYESFNYALNDLIDLSKNSDKLYEILKLNLGIKLKKGQLYPEDNKQIELDKVRHISNCIKHYDGNVDEYKKAKKNKSLIFMNRNPFNGKILLTEKMYSADVQFITRFIGYHCLQIELGIIALEDNVEMNQFNDIINQLEKLIQGE